MTGSPVPKIAVSTARAVGAPAAAAILASKARLTSAPSPAVSASDRPNRAARSRAERSAVGSVPAAATASRTAASACLAAAARPASTGFSALSGPSTGRRQQVGRGQRPTEADQPGNRGEHLARGGDREVGRTGIVVVDGHRAGVFGTVDAGRDPVVEFVLPTRRERVLHQGEQVDGAQAEFGERDPRGVRAGPRDGGRDPGRVAEQAREPGVDLGRRGGAGGDRHAGPGGVGRAVTEEHGHPLVQHGTAARRRHDLGFGRSLAAWPDCPEWPLPRRASP